MQPNNRPITPVRGPIRALFVVAMVVATSVALTGCSSGYPDVTAAPEAVGAYHRISPETAWPVILASGSLGESPKWNSGAEWVHAYESDSEDGYGSEEGAPSSRPKGKPTVSFSLYGKPNAEGRLVPTGSHDDLLEYEVWTFKNAGWTKQSAKDYTDFVREPQAKYDGAKYVHAAGDTSFSTFDMFFAITKNGFVEGGLQLDSTSDAAIARGEALMKQALDTVSG